MQIKNSVFLVTGGASGLGAATARMAAENGGKVVIADMQQDAGERLAKELGGRFVKCDVTAEADGKAAVAVALKEFGGLQVLVNCAGIGSAGRTVDKAGKPFDLKIFELTLRVNLVGTFNVTRLAATAMSQEATSWQPAATAGACTAAMNGFGQATIDCIMRAHCAISAV